MEKSPSLAPDGKDLSIHISFAKNGVTVRANCHYDSAKGTQYKNEEYVYGNLEEALKEIPSIVQVFEHTSKQKKRVKSKQEKVKGEPDDMEGDY